MKTALITGITGQDGAYLAKLLLGKGYRVVGAHRRSSSLNLWRLRELGLEEHIEFVPLELLEYENCRRTIERIEPQEIYNLGAQTFVGVSFDQPIYTSQVNGIGTAHLLEAIRAVNPAIRFYQASTSEMFGNASAPQSELTPFQPRSPYGVAKLYAHWLTVNYRESYAIHACCGILFNHESPLRGPEFVTRKITMGLAALREGKTMAPIALGNLEAMRDWGFAGDYVVGMWQMLQRDKPADYVLATGMVAKVRDFASLAACHIGMNLEWEGEGAGERATWKGRPIIRVDQNLYRPAEVNELIGDPTKARAELGWNAETLLPDLAGMMARADLAKVRRVTAIAA